MQCKKYDHEKKVIMKIFNRKWHFDTIWFGFKNSVFDVSFARYPTGEELDFHLGPFSCYIYSDILKAKS